jgi:hypothetical protein
VTLVSFDAMSSFLAKAANRSENNKTDEVDSPRNAPTPVSGNAYRLVQRHPKETELMRKLAPSLLHDLLKTISDLEQMAQAASHSG